jgi:DNA-binding NarL/FixJ family response regulator
MAVPIRVLVVDDHPAVRSAVVHLLDAAGGMLVVGEGADGRDAVKLAAELCPDVVLMDVTMPNLSGLDAAHALTQHRRGVHVLMFSADTRGSVVRAAMDAGATGFLAKGTEGSDLVRAIRAASAGRPTWPTAA